MKRRREGKLTSPRSPKILSLDIETSPAVVYKWDLRDRFSTPISMMVTPPRVLCFGAKWDFSKKTQFYGENTMEHEEMIWTAHHLLSEADIVETYNGDSFDLPWLQASFLEYKMPPPAPYKSLDLYKVAKKFRFPSRKLEYFSKVLGLEGKVQHSGIDLWTNCLAGDAKSWRQMTKYNIQDVRLLPQLREQLRPWLPAWFNLGIYLDADVCKWCGSEELVREGFSYLAVGVYQRWHCRRCGGWMRSSRKIGTEGTSIR